MKRRTNETNKGRKEGSKKGRKNGKKKRSDGERGEEEINGRSKTRHKGIKDEGRKHGRKE